MQVILQEDYPSLGYVGEVVKVKPGFARNFLLPRGIAVESGSRRGKQLAHRLEGIEAKKRKLKQEAEAKQKGLESLQLEFTLAVGKGGKSFGSISAKNILDELIKQGFDFERKQVRLLEPIKSGGDFKVEVKLHSEVTASVPVKVTAETAGVAADEEATSQEEESSEEQGAEAEELMSEDTSASEEDSAAAVEEGSEDE